MPPPNQHDRLAARRQRGEHAHVHVHRRHVGVARMEHQRDAHRLERRAGELGPVLRRRGRQRAARARARSRSRRARAARRLRGCRSRCRRPAARSPGSLLPGVATNGVAVGRFERGDDALPAGRAGSRATASASMAIGRACRARGSARWPMSRRYCMPSKRMRAARPRRRAAAPACTVSPSAVTHSTRPPLVTSSPSFERGAGMEHHGIGALRRGRPVIASPLRGASG